MSSSETMLQLLSQVHLRCMRNVTEQCLCEANSKNNSELREEEQETSSVLTFLKPLLREASEKSSSFNRRIKKRYWANVSEASTQSQDTEPSVLRRTKKTRRRRRTVEAALREPIKFPRREQRLCRRLSLWFYNIL